MPLFTILFMAFLATVSVFATNETDIDSARQSIPHRVIKAPSNSRIRLPPASATNLYTVFVGQLSVIEFRILPRLLILLRDLGLTPARISLWHSSTAYVHYRTEAERQRLLDFHHRIFARRNGTFLVFERSVSGYTLRIRMKMSTDPHVS